MSGPAGRSRTRLGALLLALYPEAWRERYGEEVRALLEDDPPRVRGLASLLAGAAHAHARPEGWGAQATPRDRLRLALCGLFGCWIGISLAGASFQKETEDHGYATAAAHHWLLAASHDAVIAGAVLGAAALAVGGLPLVWLALRRAASTRDLRLAGSLALPAAALLGFAAVTVALVALAPGDIAGRALPTQLAILVPWWTAGLALAFACALAPRMVLRRAPPPVGRLRRSAYAGPLLVAAMALIAAGMLAYDVALAVVAPTLFSESGGPVWPATGLVLAAGVAMAVLSTGLAGVAAARAHGAGRAAAGSSR
jgi:hypothetical protein